MNSISATIGTKSAQNRCDSSQPVAISARKVHTVQDLLTALQQDPLEGMLRTTASHIAVFLGTPVDQLPNRLSDRPLAHVQNTLKRGTILA
jgi:hypothetical protein